MEKAKLKTIILKKEIIKINNLSYDPIKLCIENNTKGLRVLLEAGIEVKVLDSILKEKEEARAITIFITIIKALKGKIKEQEFKKLFLTALEQKTFFESACLHKNAEYIKGTIELLKDMERRKLRIKSFSQAIS